MNGLTIGVLVLLALFAAGGWRRGLVKKLAGIVSLLLSAVLVSAALPYITSFLEEETPVYEIIVNQCGTVIEGQVAAAFRRETAGEDGSIDRDKVKAVMEQYGADSSMIDGLSDEELLALADQYLDGYEQYLDQFTVQEENPLAAGLTGMTKIEQTKLIQNLPVPKFLKDLMLDYNNKDGYRRLGAEDFADYVTRFFANIILNIVAFVVTLIVVQLIIWSVITALNLFTRLPVLHFLNKAGGLLIGVFQGLLAVWVIFLVISVLSATEIGALLMDMINRSSILKAIYDSNLFLKLAFRTASGIL